MAAALSNGPPAFPIASASARVVPFVRPPRGPLPSQAVGAPVAVIGEAPPAPAVVNRPTGPIGKARKAPTISGRAGRWRWARNVALGAGLSFADAGAAALEPVAFVWRHAQVLAQATVYLALPLIAGLMLIHHVPALSQAYALTTPAGATYLAGLYVASAFVMMLATFVGRFAWREAARAMDRFARRGEEAFPASH